MPILTRTDFLLALCSAAVPAMLTNQTAQTPPSKPEPDALLPDFLRGPYMAEQMREEWTPEGVHVIAIAPPKWETGRTTRLVFYATPNGNTAEQTLGSRLGDGTDWHFDIQHIAAQTRRLRGLSPTENIALICVQADGLSWPAWRQARGDKSASLIRALVDDWRNRAQTWGRDASAQQTTRSRLPDTAAAARFYGDF